MYIEESRGPQLLYTEGDRELMEEAWNLMAAHREDLVARLCRLSDRHGVGECQPCSEEFSAVINACRRFFDYTAEHERYRFVVDKHGLYRQLSPRRAGGGELKVLRGGCFDSICNIHEL